MQLVRESATTTAGHASEKHDIGRETLHMLLTRFASVEMNVAKRSKNSKRLEFALKKLGAERDIALDMVKELSAVNVVSATARPERMD